MSSSKPPPPPNQPPAPPAQAPKGKKKSPPIPPPDAEQSQKGQAKHAVPPPPTSRPPGSQKDDSPPPQPPSQPEKQKSNLPKPPKPPSEVPSKSNLPKPPKPPSEAPSKSSSPKPPKPPSEAPSQSNSPKPPKPPSEGPSKSNSPKPPKPPSEGSSGSGKNGGAPGQPKTAKRVNIVEHADEASEEDEPEPTARTAKPVSRKRSSKTEGSTGSSSSSDVSTNNVNTAANTLSGSHSKLEASNGSSSSNDASVEDVKITSNDQNDKLSSAEAVPTTFSSRTPTASSGEDQSNTHTSSLANTTIGSEGKQSAPSTVISSRSTSSPASKDQPETDFGSGPSTPISSSVSADNQSSVHPPASNAATSSSLTAESRTGLHSASGAINASSSLSASTHNVTDTYTASEFVSSSSTAQEQRNVQDTSIDVSSELSSSVTQQSASMNQLPEQDPTSSDGLLRSKENVVQSSSTGTASSHIGEQSSSQPVVTPTASSATTSNNSLSTMHSETERKPASSMHSSKTMSSSSSPNEQVPVSNEEHTHPGTGLSSAGGSTSVQASDAANMQDAASISGADTTPMVSTSSKMNEPSTASSKEEAEKQGNDSDSMDTDSSYLQDKSQDGAPHRSKSKLGRLSQKKLTPSSQFNGEQGGNTSSVPPKRQSRKKSFRGSSRGLPPKPKLSASSAKRGSTAKYSDQNADLTKSGTDGFSDTHDNHKSHGYDEGDSAALRDVTPDSENTYNKPGSNEYRYDNFHYGEASKGEYARTDTYRKPEDHAHDKNDPTETVGKPSEEGQDRSDSMETSKKQPGGTDKETESHEYGILDPGEEHNEQPQGMESGSHEYDENDSAHERHEAPKDTGTSESLKRYGHDNLDSADTREEEAPGTGHLMAPESKTNDQKLSSDTTDGALQADQGIDTHYKSSFGATLGEQEKSTDNSATSTNSEFRDLTVGADSDGKIEEEKNSPPMNGKDRSKYEEDTIISTSARMKQQEVTTGPVASQTTDAHANSRQTGRLQPEGEPHSTQTSLSAHQISPSDGQLRLEEGDGGQESPSTPKQPRQTWNASSLRLSRSSFNESSEHITGSSFPSEGLTLLSGVPGMRKSDHSLSGNEPRESYAPPRSNRRENVNGDAASRSNPYEDPVSGSTRSKGLMGNVSSYTSAQSTGTHTSEQVRSPGNSARAMSGRHSIQPGSSVTRKGLQYPGFSASDSRANVGHHNRRQSEKLPTRNAMMESTDGLALAEEELAGLLDTADNNAKSRGESHVSEVQSTSQFKPRHYVSPTDGSIDQRDKDLSNTNRPYTRKDLTKLSFPSQGIHSKPSVSKPESNQTHSTKSSREYDGYNSSANEGRSGNFHVIPEWYVECLALSGVLQRILRVLRSERIGIPFELSMLTTEDWMQSPAKLVSLVSYMKSFNLPRTANACSQLTNCNDVSHSETNKLLPLVIFLNTLSRSPSKVKQLQKQPTKSEDKQLQCLSSLRKRKLALKDQLESLKSQKDQRRHRIEDLLERYSREVGSYTSPANANTMESYIGYYPQLERLFSHLNLYYRSVKSSYLNECKTRTLNRALQAGRPVDAAREYVNGLKKEVRDTRHYYFNNERVERRRKLVEQFEASEHAHSVYAMSRKGQLIDQIEALRQRNSAAHEALMRFASLKKEKFHQYNLDQLSELVTDAISYFSRARRRLEDKGLIKQGRFQILPSVNALFSLTASSKDTRRLDCIREEWKAWSSNISDRDRVAFILQRRRRSSGHFNMKKWEWWKQNLRRLYHCVPDHRKHAIESRIERLDRHLRQIINSRPHLFQLKQNHDMSPSHMHQSTALSSRNLATGNRLTALTSEGRSQPESTSKKGHRTHIGDWLAVSRGDIPSHLSPALSSNVQKRTSTSRRNSIGAVEYSRMIQLSQRHQRKRRRNSSHSPTRDTVVSWQRSVPNWDR